MAYIKFVTDSAADIAPDVQKELDIQVLSFPIAMGDREYQDGVDFTPDEFYEKLLAAPQIPTHAQLTPFVFTECYEQAYENGYTHLIYISINSKGSATYQNSIQAREEFYEDHPEAKDTFRITIINSRSYTMAYGWAVVQGAKMGATGGDPEEIAAYIQDWVDHVRVLFCPLDLRFAKKSGRVSAAAAFVGDALGLKPIMTFENGDSKVLTKVRGEKNVIPAMLELCQKTRQEDTPYLVIRGNNAAQAQALTDACTQTLGAAPNLVYPIGGVIAINAGPNLIGIIYREK